MQEMDNEIIYKERNDLVEDINNIAGSMINYLHTNKADVIDLYKEVNHPVPDYLNATEFPENSVNLENIYGFQKASTEFSENHPPTDPDFKKYEKIRVDYLVFYAELYIKIRKLAKVMHELEKNDS